MDALKAEFPIKSLAIFGSYARDDARFDSDIDILVEFEKPVGFEIVDLTIKLEDLLGQKVDLVSKKAISTRMMPFIENDLKYVAA